MAEPVKPDVLPDVDAIPDQPQEMFFVKRCLRWLSDRAQELKQAVDGLKTSVAAAQAGGSTQASKIADLEKRLGVLEREPAAAAVVLPGCRIRNTSTIALADDAEVTLSFSTARWDDDSMFSLSAPTRITIRTAGRYAVGASVQITNTDADAMWVWASIRLNGTTLIVEFANASDRAGVGFNGRVNPNTVYDFVVGDYVELRVRQNNLDADAEVAAVVANTSPEFWAQCVKLAS